MHCTRGKGTDGGAARLTTAAHGITSRVSDGIFMGICCVVLGAWPATHVPAQIGPPPAPQLVLRPQTEGRLSAARDLLAEEKYQAAELATRDYLQVHPGSAEAHFLLGTILFRQNKPKDSLAEFTTGAASSKPTAADLRVVGLDYVLLDDYQDAEKWLSKSTVWDSSDAAAWYSLGRVQCELNHFSDAVQSFQRSLALEPRSVKAENNLGLAFAGLNRGDDAIAAYRQAIAWQAGAEHPSGQPLLNLGSALIDRNELVEAAQRLEEAAAISPNDAKIQEQLGRVSMLRGDLSSAAAHLERAVALEPANSRLHYQLGQVYQKQRLAEKAKAEFARTEFLNGHESAKP